LLQELKRAEQQLDRFVELGVTPIIAGWDEIPWENPWENPKIDDFLQVPPWFRKPPHE
jgi:hypothetical protein